MNVVLANIDYRQHTTDEGDQFQCGLEAAGWKLTGHGYDGNRHVPTILEKYKPQCVVVHDKRDWDPSSGICFRPEVRFKGLSALMTYPGFKAVVIKDAGSSIDYHHQFAMETKADALITYYHAESVNKLAPWMRGYPQIRTYHTVDHLQASEAFRTERKRAIVTGAVSKTYPLRQRVIQNAALMNVDVFKHPGYGNKGSHTSGYLRLLGQYKVHVATASSYGFALRKIIESVAVGAIPVTNLPAYDVLPEIDGALVRVPSDISVHDLNNIITAAAKSWDGEERFYYAQSARMFYDYTQMGHRLAKLIETEAQHEHRHV